MFVEIIKSFKGQESGKPVQKYFAGTSYLIEDADLLKVIFDQKWGHEDVLASMVATAPKTVEAAEEAPEYGLAEHEVVLLPMKKLKAIIEEEQFPIDAQGKKQSELAAEVVEALKLKYKGI